MLIVLVVESALCHSDGDNIIVLFFFFLIVYLVFRIYL